MLPRDPFTAADARAAGHSPLDIARLVANGSWIMLRRGIYCTAVRRAAASWSIRAAHILDVEAAQLAVPGPRLRVDGRRR